MKKIIKKHGFLAIVGLFNLFVLIFYPQTGINALNFTVKNFFNFIFILTPIFICIGLMDIWIERNTMIRIMGSNSGLKGIIIAFLLGMITAVPLYALLPVGGVLLKKGSRISNVMIFLCSSTSIRIPLLLFEISSLGLQFTFIRFGLNIVALFVSAFTIEKILSESDKKEIYENSENL